MPKHLSVTIKVTAMVVVAVLAAVGSLYVLEVVDSQEAIEALNKSLQVVIICAVAGLVIGLIASPRAQDGDDES